MDEDAAAAAAKAAEGPRIKFGWIQGVYVKCLLNIWGVMLFLRYYFMCPVSFLLVFYLGRWSWLVLRLFLEHQYDLVDSVNEVFHRLVPTLLEVHWRFAEFLKGHLFPEPPFDFCGEVIPVS
jgi:hypothetical protein